MSSRNLSRRTFLATSALAGTAATLATSPLRAAGSASEQVNIGLIGCGGRMGGLLNQFSDVEGVKVVSICDPDSARTDGMLKQIKKKVGSASDVKVEKDLRKLLEDKDVDAVVIATCNHWHCLATIWACEAGKHVYVEKPLGNNLWEEQQTVLAARKYNRIVQVGTQQRSDPMQAELKQYLHGDQKLGKPQYVIATRFGPRAPIGKRDTPLTPPKTVDYDLWLGPAEDQALYRDKLHYDWHWDWNTGAGEMGNWGVHILDDVRNVALQDEESLPTGVAAGGGRVLWGDAGNTPNVHFVAFETETLPVLFALSNLKPTPNLKKAMGHLGPGAGYAVYCEGGILAGQRARAVAYDNDGKAIKKFKGDSGNLRHQKNFIEAVRASKRDGLNAEVEVGHYSSSWCHLANVACRAGQPMPAAANWSGQLEGAPAGTLLDSMKSYLAGQKVAIESSGIVISDQLAFDPETQRFVGSGSESANKWIGREYRTGFEIEAQA